MILDAVWLVLLSKMAIVAVIVVSASVLAERASALAGAMVATLPISAGPAYVFLAIEHGDAFIAEATLASLAINAVTVMFSLAYAALAQRRGMAVSLAAAFAIWLPMALFIQTREWDLPTVLVMNALACGLGIPLSRRFTNAKMPPVKRRWYDLPFRALLVGAVVGVVTTFSEALGPKGTGVGALFPVVLTSLIVILHPRVGGPPTAAIIANGLPGLLGFAVAVVVLRLTVLPLGAAAALSLALAVSMGWNLALMLTMRRR